MFNGQKMSSGCLGSRLLFEDWLCLDVRSFRPSRLGYSAEIARVGIWSIRFILARYLKSRPTARDFCLRIWHPERQGSIEGPGDGPQTAQIWNNLSLTGLDMNQSPTVDCAVSIASLYLYNAALVHCATSRLSLFSRNNGKDQFHGPSLGLKVLLPRGDEVCHLGTLVSFYDSHPRHLRSPMQPEQLKWTINVAWVRNNTVNLVPGR